jgi:D-serine deaminase-like pyridoxal phosphate-dependent protein
MTCSTPEEVACLAAAGVTDLLLANVVASPERLKVVADAAHLASVTAVVDSPATVDLLAAAARAAGARVGVLVELDIGMDRNGAVSVADGLALAHDVARRSPLVLRGLQAYEGHLVDVPDRAERERRVVEAFAPAVELCGALVRGGLVDEPVIGGGSTATYRAAANGAGPTELQAGTFALMDVTYRAFAPEFEIAIAMVATVSTARPDGRIVVDAGSKRMGLDWGVPNLLGRPSTYLGTSEEHTMFRVQDAAPPPVGSRVLLGLGHVCTTVAMHRHLFAVASGSHAEIVAVDGRDVHA